MPDVNMLFLVGLGLGKKDISIKGLEILRNADEVYLESYTLPVDKEYLNYLKKQTTKEVQETKRQDFEDNVKKFVERARKSKVVVLVSGDPLVATTHHVILDAARKAGIKVEVSHAPSVFSVGIGESGLDIYKFGPTTTIPFWSEKYKPVSFLGVIKRNLGNKQHTLVLLDVDPISERTMNAGEATELLKKAEEAKKEEIISDRKILFLIDAGTSNQRIIYSKIDNKKLNKFPKSKTSLIIPATISFAEEEHLEKFQG